MNAPVLVKEADRSEQHNFQVHCRIYERSRLRSFVRSCQENCKPVAQWRTAVTKKSSTIAFRCNFVLLLSWPRLTSIFMSLPPNFSPLKLRSFNITYPKPTKQGRDGNRRLIPLHSRERPRKQLFVRARKSFARRGVPGAAAYPGREHGAAAVHPTSGHRGSGCEGHCAGVHTGEAGERVVHAVRDKTQMSVVC